MVKNFALMILFILNPFPLVFADASAPNSNIPSESDVMPISQQVKIQPQITELLKLRDQILQDSWHERLEVWRSREEKDGVVIEKTLGFKEGKSRLYMVATGWRHCYQEETYIYDADGHLRIIVTFGLISGKRQVQTVFIDKKGNVLEVEYFPDGWGFGVFFDSPKKEILNKPMLLTDVTILSFVWKPFEELNKNSLAALSSKSGSKTQYPFLGVVVGEPEGLNIVAGYDWEHIGLKAEGIYWNTNSYNVQTDITVNISGDNNSGPFYNLLFFRTDLVYVFGFRNDSSTSSTARFYSGLGIDKSLGLMTIEIDLVNDGFWNFNNAWMGFARIGFIHIFD